MDKRVGKRDLILLLAAAAAAVMIFAGYRLLHQGQGTEVKVTVEKETYGVYSLDENQEIPITINGKVTNTLVIQDKTADMTDADCPDLLCVHQKAISSPGETIVCLPNQVVVEIIGAAGDEAEFDTIAK